MNEREQGQEDVLRFIRKGRFLSDAAPTAQFAREVEKGWLSWGKVDAEKRAIVDKAVADTKPIHFRKAIEDVINRFSMENGSDTPDFILAEFLTDCLAAFDKTTRERTRWYTKPKEPATEAELDAILNAPAPEGTVVITPDGRVREVRNQEDTEALDRAGVEEAKLHPERYFNPETGDRDF